MQLKDIQEILSETKEVKKNNIPLVIDEINKEIDLITKCMKKEQNRILDLQDNSDFKKLFELKVSLTNHFRLHVDIIAQMRKTREVWIDTLLKELEKIGD